VVFAGAVDPTNYIADDKNPVLSTETVTISGPEKVVKQIAMARIDINLDGKTESIEDEFPITLCDKEGKPVDAKWITVSQDDVKVQVKIAMVKKLPIQLEVKEGGGATESNITLKQSIQEIEVSGSNAILQDMTSLVVGTIDLSQVTKDQTFTFPIQLPEGITNESGVAEVTVDISFPNLARKKFTIPKERFTTIGIPAGGTANWITEMVEVELRGPKNAIESITESDISVIVDFTDEALGSVSKVPRIVLSSAYSTVGPISVSQVTAMLQVGDNNATIG
jgi:YbbR domain-containing protein